MDATSSFPRSCALPPFSSFTSRLPDPAWQAYDLISRRLKTGTQEWTLQPIITFDNFTNLISDQFLYASPNAALFLYQEGGGVLIAPTIPDAAEVMIANVNTGESMALSVPSRIPFSPQSRAKVLWASTNHAVAFSITSTGEELVEAFQIYHVSITSLSPLSVLVREMNVQVDGIIYTTVYFDDRLLSIASDGGAVLLIGRQNAITSLNGAPGKLILWKPNNPTSSVIIDTLIQTKYAKRRLFLAHLLS